MGILYAKDLLPFLKTDAASRPTPLAAPDAGLRAGVAVDRRPAPRVPAPQGPHRDRARRVRRDGGLVTIEDLLEEIVGEIQDEYDEEEPLVERIGDDRARVDGRASVEDLLDLWDIKTPLEDDAEYDTVGGLVYHRIGGVPSPGDEIQVDGLRLTVETTDGRRVGKVLVVHERRDDESAADGEG